jgi:TPR repeat protein
LKQWHVLGTGIGQRQRRAVIFRGGLFEQLLRRLLFCPGNLNAMFHRKHAKFVLLQRHFLGLKNQADRLFREGRSLYDEQLFANAAKCWAQAILLMHPESHAHLSTMLIERRRGVPLDENLAFRIAEAGARLHCMHSFGVVSRCMNGGCGVKSDLAGAFAFAKISHASSSSFGTFALADCYREGRGVAKNLAKAVRLYRLSAAKGHVASSFALALCLCEEYPLQNWPSSDLWDLEEAEESRKQALFHLHHAAERGYGVAQNVLASLYQNGSGVMQDATQFNRWASLAAEQGCRFF